MNTCHDHKYIAYNLPKADLHCHIEGAIQPELLLKLAKKHNNQTLLSYSIDEIREMYHFNNLEEFLKLYITLVKVVIDEDDYCDLMFSYLQTSHQQGLKYAEVFLDVQSIIYNGNKLSDGINGLYKGKIKAKEELGIESNIIICFLRDKPLQDALSVFDQILLFREKFVAIGLASNELGYPPENFIELFNLAHSYGINTVAHAGEESSIPCEYIYTCINKLKVKRIDHGIQSVKDKELLLELKEKQIPLTLCPISNIKLKVFEKLEDFPLKIFLENKLNVSLHSDDPGFFEHFIGDVYYETGKAFNLSIADYQLLAENSFRASFLPDNEKERLVAEVIDFCKLQGKSKSLISN